MRFHFRFVIGLTVSLVTNVNAQAPDAKKVLRYAFEVAETSFDPQKVSDV